jgi:hypothetical protein
MTKRVVNKNEVIKNELFNIFTGLKNGSVKKEDANTMIKASNAICNVVKTEIALAKFNTENGTNRGRKKKLTL